jgi:L-alanine-DL-glutamate epimerase-like enolase superfamily enzyme
VEIRARTSTLPLAHTFAISRRSSDSAEVVQVEIEHDGLVGLGEAAPIYYNSEEPAGGVEFLLEEAQALVAGESPFDLELIGDRLADVDGQMAAKAALDGALHDWVGKRLGVPVWQLLGLTPDAPPTSYTVAIASIDETRERAREAAGFRALKLKVGTPEDLERLRAVREETPVPLRVDANEGWTLETARELVPELVALGVELIEQPFPAGDEDSLAALAELHPRPPIVLDESCHDLGDVAPAARHADGINIKLAKAGGLREAMRMIHAARALGLRVMLGCMVESQLAVAPAAHIASLVDWVDLDGHLLLAEQPFTGLELVDGRVLPPEAPGLGVRATA